MPTPEMQITNFSQIPVYSYYWKAGVEKTPIRLKLSADTALDCRSMQAEFVEPVALVRPITCKTIHAGLYKELFDCRLELRALEAGGVDNWEGYSDALDAAGLLSDDEETDDD